MTLSKEPKQSIVILAREIDSDLRVIKQILREPVQSEIARGGLTGPQQNAMHVLANSDGMSLQVLSKELGLAHSTVSGIVDRLEKRGMVVRQTNETDRRRSKIVVSRQVRDYLRDVLPMLGVQLLVKALAASTQSEQKISLRGVRALRHALERANAKQPVLTATNESAAQKRTALPEQE